MLAERMMDTAHFSILWGDIVWAQILSQKPWHEKGIHAWTEDPKINYPPFTLKSFSLSSCNTPFWKTDFVISMSRRVHDMNVATAVWVNLLILQLSNLVGVYWIDCEDCSQAVGNSECPPSFCVLFKAFIGLRIVKMRPLQRRIIHWAKNWIWGPVLVAR